MFGTNKKTILLVLFVWTLLIRGYLNEVNVRAEQVGNHAGSIIWDGLERTYLIHIPPSFKKTKQMPLVIALHGGGGTGEAMVSLTLGSFNSLSDKENFIVVYPDGFEKHWNDGRPEVKYSAHRENIDDVGFIRALIDHFIKELNIDPKRVYITGMSNGAIMSFRLACELSEKIAAIAPVAGAMIPSLASNTAPLRPVSVLIISNTDDQLAPWEGTDFRFNLSKLGKKLSVSDTVKLWVTHNKCSSAPEITNLPDKDPQDNTRVKKEVYGKGREGTEVILYTIEGGGHTWPGGYQYLSERIIGKTSRDIDANEVIWNFFKKHSRN